MATTHTIGKYQLAYYGRRPSESDKIAQLTFYNNQNELLGFIAFFKEGQVIPDNSEDTTRFPTRVYLRASENQLDRIVDMLRNEKPCYVRYNSPTHAFVYTGTEPVGEEEAE